MHSQTWTHLPPHNISLGHPHAPAPSMLHPTSDMDWRFNSYMTVYMLEFFTHWVTGQGLIADGDLGGLILLSRDRDAFINSPWWTRSDCWGSLGDGHYQSLLQQLSFIYVFLIDNFSFLCTTSPFNLTHSLGLGFPCGSAGKESACNVGDLGLLLGLGRFPGEGKG